MTTPRLYPAGEYRDLGRAFVKTGQFRPPRAGEYYLSGARPVAYLAPHDLSIPYRIMRPATPEESICPCCKRPLPMTD